MQPSNVILVPVQKDNVFGMWLKFFQPLLNLSPKETEAAVFLLNKWFEMMNDVGIEAVVDSNLINKDSKTEMMNKLKLKDKKGIEVLLSRLRDRKFIENNTINKKYMPIFDKNGKISLLILYDVRD